MAVFVQGRPITTREPVITVDAGMTIGSHRFQLVVVDSAGLSSRADAVLVRIAAGVGGPGGIVVRPTGSRTQGHRSPR